MRRQEEDRRRQETLMMRQQEEELRRRSMGSGGPRQEDLFSQVKSLNALLACQTFRASTSKH